MNVDTVLGNRELAKAWLDGAVIQHRKSSGDIWEDCPFADPFPYNFGEYRVKPERIKIKHGEKLITQRTSDDSLVEVRFKIIPFYFGKQSKLTQGYQIFAYVHDTPDGIAYPIYVREGESNILMEPEATLEDVERIFGIAFETI